VPSRGPAGRRNQNKRAFQQAVPQALPRFLARFTGPVIIAGDLNIVEPEHIPHHRVFGTWEYDFYRSFCDAGLSDGYRTLHPDATEHSWLGRSGQGYRFDHVFLTTRHRAQISTCGYLHAPRHQGLTDHAAMTLTMSTENMQTAGILADPSGRSSPAGGAAVSSHDSAPPASLLADPVTYHRTSRAAYYLSRDYRPAHVASQVLKVVS
jgi:hypothetical protein